MQRRASRPPAVASTPWLVSRRVDLVIFGGAILAFVATYLFYYPPIYQTDDDASYLAEALALRHGHLTLNSLHQSIVQTFSVGHHLVSLYPPGMPALLAVASLLGWNAALGVNLVVVLATCAVVAYVLRRHQCPMVFALLFLLYPTAVLFSRTVMADLLSGLLIAAAVAALIDKRPFVVGLLLGVSVIVRSANVLACATIPAGVMFDLWRQDVSVLGGTIRAGAGRLGPAFRWIAKFAAGAVPGGVGAAMAYFAVGGGHGLKNTGHFAFHYLVQHLPLLVLGLIVVYPLMLFAPAVFRSPVRTPVALTCYGFLLLYAAWFFESKGPTLVETLVLSERFMLVVIPLFVVAYASVLWSILSRLRVERLRPRWRAIAAAAAAILLVAGSVAIQRRDQSHTRSLAEVRAALLRAVRPADLLVCDKEVAKLFLPQWGSRQIYIVDTQSSGAVRRFVEAWVSQPGPARRQVLVASWAAGGLSATVTGERDAATVVKGLLPTVSLSDAPRGLPPDFQLLRVATPLRSQPHR